MDAFTRLISRAVCIPAANIDTDQIIPGRYLKTTTRVGLGAGLFADWRYDAGGHPRPGFVLNQPAAEGAQILLAGDNFGCGSSREHAPWALIDHGFRAVVSTSFGDIFRNNALKNGLLPVVLENAAHRRLLDLHAAEPQAAITIDLADQSLACGDLRAGFPLDLFSKACLLEGVDELGFLIKHEPEIAAYERRTGAR
jgi:3-isopropylmalate/(R)-2-methylmalate dehydratase small subunit